VIDSGDTAWIITAAALVLLMPPSPSDCAWTVIPTVGLDFAAHGESGYHHTAR
jgi:hypothetical protein